MVGTYGREQDKGRRRRQGGPVATAPGVIKQRPEQAGQQPFGGKTPSRKPGEQQRNNFV